MTKLKELQIDVLEKILDPEKADLRKRMNVNDTDEKLLAMIKATLEHTDKVWKIQWESLPDYCNVDGDYILLKDEYRPVIKHSYSINQFPYQPVYMIKAFDGDYLISDTNLGVVKIDKDSLEIKAEVIKNQYNTPGYRYYEDNNRVAGPRLLSFTTPTGNFYAAFMRANYGDFIVKFFSENFEYLGMKRLRYNTDTFSQRFSLERVSAYDYNHIFMSSQYGGDTDGSGTILGDGGVVYVGYITVDNNGIPNGFDFYRKDDGYPLAVIGISERYVTNWMDPDATYRPRNCKVIGQDIYVLQANKISKFTLQTPGDPSTNPVTNPEIVFDRIYTTPPEVRDWITNWTAIDMLFNIEDGIPYLYVVLGNVPLYYGIAKVDMLNFKLVSFVGDYLYTYNSGNTLPRNPINVDVGPDDEIEGTRNYLSGTTFGNIVSFDVWKEGLLILDYGNRDLKWVPFTAFDVTGTMAISKEYTLPHSMSLLEMIPGSNGKYYISINNGDWIKLKGQYINIPENTPFKFKRKFYAYELLNGEKLNIGLRFIID